MLIWDIYEGNIFRPPSEADSLILQATIGCSWDRCTFCTAFMGKKFRIKKLDEIKKDVEYIHKYYEHSRRIFLADANALCIPTPDLVEILDYLYEKFPSLERVNLYGGPLDIKEKSLEELKLLKKHGLQMIYIGLESGSDTILKRVKKGALSHTMIEVGQKVKESGLKLSVIYILGLGGKELSEEHSLETARVISGMDPDYCGALTLMLEPGAPIIKDIESGKMTLLEPDEALRELRLLVENLEVSNCIFRANHASNYVPFRGTLPGDKKNVLEQIDRALKGGSYKPDSFRRL